MTIFISFITKERKKFPIKFQKWRNRENTLDCTIKTMYKKKKK